MNRASDVPKIKTMNDDHVILTYAEMLAFRASVRIQIGTDPADLVERCVALGICTRPLGEYQRSLERIKERVAQ